VTEASQRFGLPLAWIERVMHAESAGRTTLGCRPIVSRAGAMGLMQLMPGTWAAMRKVLALGRDPFDPHDNILAGTAYLRLMYDRFGYPGMFAAYNAGPGRYAAWLAGQQPLPGETVDYLAAVTDGSPVRREVGAGRRRSGIFVTLDRSAVALKTGSPPVASTALFVIQKN
jgi:soluble lytic murein transglycosylase-like protein